MAFRPIILFSPRTMLPLLNYEQNIFFLCRFMPFSPFGKLSPRPPPGQGEKLQTKMLGSRGRMGLMDRRNSFIGHSFFIYRIVPSGGYPGSGYLFTALYGCFQHSFCRHLPCLGQRVPASRRVQTVHYKQIISLLLLLTRFSSLIGQLIRPYEKRKATREEKLSLVNFLYIISFIFYIFVRPHFIPACSVSPHV